MWLNAFTVGPVNDWRHLSSIKLTETWYVYCKAESFFIFLDILKFVSFVGTLEHFVEACRRSNCHSEFPRFFNIMFSSHFVTLSMK
jgi:hypothetical protein